MTILLKSLSSRINSQKITSSLDFDAIQSVDFARNDCIKKLVNKFHFWDGVNADDPQITSGIIKETFIAIANYFDLAFPANADVMDITQNLLRLDSSKFFESLRDKKDIALIDLMKSYIIHNLTLANIIEESNPANKAIIQEKIINNLGIFPGHQYVKTRLNRLTGLNDDEITTDIDFVCLPGTLARLNMANQALIEKQLYELAIDETTQEAVFHFNKMVTQVNAVHLIDHVISLLSLKKINDFYFYSPDIDISIHDIREFLKNFTIKIAENISKELNKYCLELSNTRNYDELKNIYEQVSLKLLIDFEMTALFKDDADIDYDLIVPDNFKSQVEIREVLEAKLLKQFPEIYYDYQQIYTDSLRHLNGLDIYCDANHHFLDHLKIDNLIALLMPDQTDEDRVNKIEAGILFLHLLARDFKDSDPVFFLMLLNKLAEKNPAQIGEDGQVIKSFLDVYFDSIPRDLKQEGFDTRRIIDYISAKKDEKYRKNFSDFYLSYEKYKSFLLSGVILRGDDPSRYIEYATNFNHLNALKIIGQYVNFELIVEIIIPKKNHHLLQALLDDDQLFIGDDKKITDESINKILLYAYGSDNVKLLLSAINRGVDMKPLIYGSFLPRSDKTILEMSIFSNKNDDMTVALLEEASKQNNHASDVNKIFFNGVLTRCCKNLIAIEKIEILKKFLKKMPLIPDELYMSAMIFKKIEIALVLIENGANVNAFDPQNRKSLLQLALETKQTEIASALIQKGADLSLLFGVLPLANFILKKIEDQSKALEILKIIFAKNPDSIIQINVNYQHDLISHTKNLLHLACKNGFEEIVEYLLNSEDIPRDKRANPNLRDSSGNLPIVIVCENFRSSSENKLKMIDSLTRAGADLKIKDKEGYDLCRNAILIQDSKSFFEKIYKNRSTLEKIKTKLSGRDKILLKEAIQLSNLECIKCMYENLFPKAQGCSPASCLTISNKELNELFTLAVKDSKNLECAKFFLDKGADLNHQNSAGDKSIDIYLKNFLELPTENFLTSYTLDNFRPDDANYRTDIINITSGKTIKFLVENNCKIDDKTKKMLENFITANPNPDPDTREGMATALKLSFLTKLQSLIEQRIPLPLPLSPSAQLVRSQARANQSW